MNEKTAELTKISCNGAPFEAITAAEAAGMTDLAKTLRGGVAHVSGPGAYKAHYRNRAGQAGWQIDSGLFPDPRQEKVLEIVASYAPEIVLDAGGADGTLLAYYGRRQPQTALILVDPWRDGCRWFRQHCLAQGLNGMSVDKVFEELEGAFDPDVIVMAEVLEHVLNPQAYVDKAKEMEPDAIVITVPTGRPDPHEAELTAIATGAVQEHVRQVSINDLAKWLGPEYAITRNTTVNVGGWRNLIVGAESCG